MCKKFLYFNVGSCEVGIFSSYALLIASRFYPICLYGNAGSSNMDFGETFAIVNVSTKSMLEIGTD